MRRFKYKRGDSRLMRVIEGKLKTCKVQGLNLKELLVNYIKYS